MDKSNNTGSLLRRTDLGFYSAQYIILEVELGVDIAREFHVNLPGCNHGVASRNRKIWLCCLYMHREDASKSGVTRWHHHYYDVQSCRSPCSASSTCSFS